MASAYEDIMAARPTKITEDQYLHQKLQKLAKTETGRRRQLDFVIKIQRNDFYHVLMEETKIFLQNVGEEYDTYENDQDWMKIFNDWKGVYVT